MVWVMLRGSKCCRGREKEGTMVCQLVRRLVEALDERWGMRMVYEWE
jgi:hypothetical protein